MILLLGADGFVGSSFARLFHARGLEYAPVTRDGYPAAVGGAARVLVNAAANSRKYLAERDWHADFDASVAFVARTLTDFDAGLYVLLSSVDVYDRIDDPAQNAEGTVIDPFRLSNYGFHKYIAEACVRRYAKDWLIVRLAGMVGPGLRKNPVFDIVNGRPLSIHPDSQYQFMSTDAVAAAVWRLIESNVTNTVVNVCGTGLISPREIAQLADKSLTVDPAVADAAPRIVNVSNRLASSMVDLPDTRTTIAEYVTAVTQSDQTA